MGTKKASAEELDLRKALRETFAINQKANEKLVEAIAEAAWSKERPEGKGRTIAATAAHLHNVRLMWLKAADKAAKLPGKLEGESATRAETQAALKASAAAVDALLEKALADPEGRVPQFKPNVAAFVGYLVAHDAHHRGQMAMLARQLGHPLDAKASYGLWEWGTLWKESGFGEKDGGKAK